MPVSARERYGFGVWMGSMSVVGIGVGVDVGDGGH